MCELEYVDDYFFFFSCSLLGMILSFFFGLKEVISWSDKEYIYRWVALGRDRQNIDMMLRGRSKNILSPGER